MFAIIRTGGKQYRVAEGDRIEIERTGDAEGATVSFDDVLMIGGGDGGDVVGTPKVEGARVTAEVEALSRGPKLIVFKKRRRQNSRRKNGHRQDLMRVKITGVSAP